MVSPHELLEGQPEAVRVTTVDGTETVLREPIILGDSIQGMVSDEEVCRLSVAAGGRRICSRPDERALIALTEVATLEEQAQNGSRAFSGAFVVGTIGAVVGLFRGSPVLFGAIGAVIGGLIGAVADERAADSPNSR